MEIVDCFVQGDDHDDHDHGHVRVHDHGDHDVHDDLDDLDEHVDCVDVHVNDDDVNAYENHYFEIKCLCNYYIRIKYKMI